MRNIDGKVAFSNDRNLIERKKNSETRFTACTDSFLLSRKVLHPISFCNFLLFWVILCSLEQKLHHRVLYARWIRELNGRRNRTQKPPDMIYTYLLLIEITWKSIARLRPQVRHLASTNAKSLTNSNFPNCGNAMCRFEVASREVMNFQFWWLLALSGVHRRKSR